MSRTATYGHITLKANIDQINKNVKDIIQISSYADCNHKYILNNKLELY